MNHQGQRGQVNSNPNIQTQGRALRRLQPSSSSFSAGSDRSVPDINLPPENNGHSAGGFLLEPTGALGLSISSSNSLTRSPLRFPDRLSGSGVVHHQGTIHSIPQNIMDSTAENVGNINLDLSLGLSQNPTGSQNQNGNSSSLNEINNGTHGSILTNTARVPSKRRSTVSGREFVAGESSSMSAQAGIAKRLAPGASSHINVNNNMNTSSPLCIGPGNTHPRGFEGAIGQGTIIPASDQQNQSFQNNINMQTPPPPPPPPQAYAQTNRFSNGYSRDLQSPLLPNNVPLVFPINTTPFLNSSETAYVGTFIQQPREHAPLFGPVLLGFPSISYMNSRNPLPQPMLHYYQLCFPFHGQRNIQGNIPVSLSFIDGTGHFQGNLPYSSELNGSYPGNVILSNAAIRVPHFYMHEQEHPMRMVYATVLSNPGAYQGIAFTGESSHGSSASAAASRSSQEMNPRIPISNPTTGNTSGIQAGGTGNAEQPPRPRGPLVLRDPEMRALLATRARTAMERLRNGLPIRFEDLMYIDYSVVLHLIEQVQVAAGGQNENMEPGLTEEVIMNNIRHENFDLVAEEAPENKEECCICQEEYTNGEEIGRLDCSHIFHIQCIKQWLMVKNVCPICKRKGISSD